MSEDIDIERIKELPKNLQMEIVENIYRKDFTQKELAKIQSKLKEEFSERTEQGRRTDLQADDESGEGTSSNILEEVGEGEAGKDRGVIEDIGEIFNESHENVRRRMKVYEASEKDPEEFGDLEDKMEDSIHSAYKEYQRRKEIKEREEQTREKEVELKNLYQGDCLDKIEEIPEGSVDCVVTDPPYGIEWNTGSRSSVRELRENWSYEGDNDDIYPLLYRLFEKMQPKLKEDVHLYIFTSWKTWHKLLPVVDEFFEVKNMLIYLHYLSTGGSFYQYRNGASIVMFASKGRRKLQGDRWNYFDVRGEKRKEENYHPAQKSVSFCEELISNSTVEGETVLDPFAGSGSTLVAAEQLDRSWIGIELEDKFCDIIQQRIEEVRNDE